VLRAPAVTPRDLEMRPSGTLQSPTTGSLEAMLREVDQEDQLAAARLEQRNATAKVNDPAASSSVPVTAKSEETAPASGTSAANPAAAPSTTVATVGSNAGVTKDPGVFQTAPASQQTTVAAAAEDELSAFVPAPKSLVTSQSASEVAAINTNLNTGANAVLTSLPKPIEAAVSSVNAPVRAAQIS